MMTSIPSESKYFFHYLPEELLLRVFSFLNYDSLLKLAQVSKEFNRISNDSELWKSLFELDLDLLPFVQNTTLTLNKPSISRSINTAMTWKQLYYESYLKQSTIKNNNPSALPPGMVPRPCTSESAVLSRMQRNRILYIGPKKSGKSTLFYHLRFGTSFKGIYYLRKFGTVVQIDLALASKTKKTHASSPGSHSFSTGSHEPHGFEILPADLEVHDVEDFEALPFKRNILPDAVIIVVDSTTLSNSAAVCHLTSLLSSPHIGADTVPLLVLATRSEEAQAMRAAAVARELGIWAHPTRPWRVQACSAVTLVGVREGLAWLHGEIKDRKSWES